MIQLINYSHIQAYKDLSSDIDSEIIDSPIKEAQDFDLRPFLGDQLYFDLIADQEAKANATEEAPYTEKYGDLLRGSTYTYNGVSYTHEGLIPILCYFAYSRYVLGSGAHSTRYGIVQKKTDYSDPATEKTLARLSGQSESAAIVFQQRVRNFLNRKSSDFPLWIICQTNPRKGKITLTSIGGNSKGAKRKCRFCNSYNCTC